MRKPKDALTMETMNKGDYITLLGGNIKFDDEKRIFTSSTRQGVCFKKETDMIQSIRKNSQFIADCYAKYNKTADGKFYRISATVKVKSFDMLNSLSLLSTKYLFTICIVKKDVIIITSCKYVSFNKASKVLEQLFDEFKVVDCGIREVSLIDNTSKDVTSDINGDVIKGLQKRRAEKQYISAWVTNDKQREIILK